MPKYHDLLRDDQRGRAKRPVSPIPCAGYQTAGPDGGDYDCDYEFAGEIDCDQCVCCGGAYDPRTGKKYRKRKGGA
jgi:hypothetical protein